MEQIRVATFAGPGAQPIMREGPRPKIPRRAALMQVGACGVCGTDLHILAGHWPKPLPWPFTLGHEVAGLILEIGDELREDYMGNPLQVGSRIMLPPFMPCGRCYYCIHYPKHANKCLSPVYYGRYLGFDKPPHLWGGWAEAEYLDLEMLPGTKIYRLPEDMPLWLGTLAEPLTSSLHGLKRAQEMGCFQVGDTVVIQGSGPIGVLAIVAARAMGAGRVIVVGAPEAPRLALCRKFGAEATVDITKFETPEKRIAAARGHEEVRADHPVERQQDQGDGDHREGGDHQEVRHERHPHEDGHPHQGHARSPHVEDRDDEVERRRERRNAQHLQPQRPEVDGMAGRVL